MMEYSWPIIAVYSAFQILAIVAVHYKVQTINSLVEKMIILSQTYFSDKEGSNIVNNIAMIIDGNKKYISNASLVFWMMALTAVCKFFGLDLLWLPFWLGVIFTTALLLNFLALDAILEATVKAAREIENAVVTVATKRAYEEAGVNLDNLPPIDFSVVRDKEEENIPKDT